MIYRFLDTSAILNEALSKYQHVYISPIVLQELEHIKNTSYKNEKITVLARKAIKQIINSEHIFYTRYSQKKILRLLKKYNFLMDINDHHILCEAELLGQEINGKIEFITSDGGLYLFAQHFPHLQAIYFEPEEFEQKEYSGWGNYYPSDSQMIELYSHLDHNVLDVKTNQFIKIYEGKDLKDVMFWNGQTHRKLLYKEFTSVLGEKIKPRNLEQKMYLDLLQNKNIPIKLCNGKFGTGKSYLALQYSLDAVEQGRFQKIIFVKNNLEVKGAGKLGTLPGDEISKQYPWLRQIEDHLGIQKFEEYLKEGIIEPAHLTTLRGRDLKNCIIFVDEAENLLVSNIQLLIGRIAQNSELIFCADIKQCDYQNEKDSGISRLIERLSGNKLFGMVKLIKTERSEAAALADLLD